MDAPGPRCLHEQMTTTVDVDYLVVGAGAMGMAFTDALIDHSDATVALVDHRHTVGGHWLDAYPFVRLHQASAFYGVASTLLGGGRLQDRGPEKGLQERADRAQICAYYTNVLEARMLASGRVEFFGNCEYLGDRGLVSLVSGLRIQVPDRCRIVDARYLAPAIPARTPPPFAVDDDARVVPAGALATLAEPAAQYVVVGSGKTATDACVWLLGRGVDPDAICWVRPRDPWMLNRAVVQPDAAVFVGMVADIMEAAAASETLEEMFLRLEDAGVMLRIDRSVTPTMAKTPTLATWEAEQLRTIEDVVRRGHVQRVQRGRLVLSDGTVDVADDAVVVHCAAPGLQYPPTVPIWSPRAITLQPVRSGFPCFGAAAIGYVEATRADDDEKNRLCRPTPYANSLPGWAAMTALGAKSAAGLLAEPDVKEWTNRTTLNPARMTAADRGSAKVGEALERMQRHTPAGLARLAELGVPDSSATASELPTQRAAAGSPAH